MSDLPAKSGTPVAISAKMHPTDQASTPTDQASTAAEYRLAPRRSSGARYHKVTTSYVYGPLGRPDRRARPKSASLTLRPSALIRSCMNFDKNENQMNEEEHGLENKLI